VRGTGVLGRRDKRYSETSTAGGTMHTLVCSSKRTAAAAKAAWYAGGSVQQDPDFGINAPMVQCILPKSSEVMVMVMGLVCVGGSKCQAT
jgi:hypothetical protein